MKAACGSRLSTLGLAALATLTACAGARIDPQFSPEPRLEATIEAIGDEVGRLRSERDSLTAANDSLRLELARLRLELQRIKDIDLKRRRPKPP